MGKIRSVSEMERRARPLATERAGVALRHQPKNIPFRPDYGNRSKMVAVFVHGCFWHVCPRHHKMPKTNKAFWRKKFERNVATHRRSVRALRKEGYTIITIWEHEVSRYASAAARRSSLS